MAILKIDSHELLICDHVFTESSVIMDISFESGDSFESFYKFYRKNIKLSSLQKYEIDGVPYSGFLGTLVYDLKYNIRLYIVQNEPFDSSAISTLHYNLLPIIDNHEKRIDMLTDILKNKGLLSEEEAASMVPYLKYTEIGLDIAYQVVDLQQYLIDTHITINELCELFKK